MNNIKKYTNFKKLSDFYINYQKNFIFKLGINRFSKSRHFDYLNIFSLILRSYQLFKLTFKEL